MNTPIKRVDSLIRWLVPIVLASVSWAWCSSTSAQQRECTQTEARRAESESDTLRNWDALHNSYKRYGHCDDGAIAEGYSESVARILVDHWTTLSRLSPLASADPKFLKFVLRHLNTTLNPDDIKKVRANTITHCPSGLHTLCVDQSRQAQSALKEL